MCTQKEFKKVFKTLKKTKKESVDKFIDNQKDINKTSVMDAIERLLVLGFAHRIKYLNGKEEIELTEKGKEMYSVLY
jgi:hypothetical protein